MKTTTIASIAFTTCLMLSGCAEDSIQTSRAFQTDVGANDGKESMESSLPVRGAGATVRDHVPRSEVLTDKHSNLLALSAEEAAWLDRHGYPTSAEIDALHTYDVEALRSATRNRKDPKAAALLGHRMLLDGDVAGAWAAFAVGADQGSLYARQQMALVSAHRITGLPIDDLEQADQGNLGILLAQLEVARLLGDHRAQSLIDRYGTNFYWDDYGKQVLAQTAIFMDQYGEYARARGERVMGPDPRPNAEAWAALQEDPNALVTVYTRGRSYP